MATRSTKASRSAYTCGLYLPGHDVHWIQGLHSGADKENPARAGMLVGAHPDGTLVIEVAGEQLRLWNHNPSRLVRLVGRNHGEIEYQPRWHLLWTRSVDGRYAFCIADVHDPERRPCPSSPPSGDLIELLQEAGGFSVPASRLQALLPRDAGDLPGREPTL